VSLLLLGIGIADAQSLATPSPLDPAHGAELFDSGEDASGFRAAAGLALAYDSNVYATRTDVTAEPLTVGELLLLAKSRSARREFDARGYARSRRFSEAADQDTDEFGAALRYALWADAQDELSASMAAEQRFESRVDMETPTNIPVSVYDNFNGELKYAHRFNRLRIETEGQARRYQYEDATQQYRDRSVYHAQLEGVFETRADLAWTFTAYYNRDAYDDPGPNTDSADTFGALTGVRIDLREMLELELGAGYFERHFESGAEPLDGIALRGSLIWHPTRLTQVRGELRRSDEPTQIPGALAKIRTDGSIQVAHDYSRSLQLFMGARMVFDNFVDDSRVDRLYLAELGGNLQLGRHVVLRFAYYYGSRDNASPDRNFSRHLASLSFIGRL